MGGRPVADPTYLVCTNGKHDVSCATYGLPVARALDPMLGDRMWECSHVGGDRSAGNLVCLPEGIFYAHLDPATAAAAVAAHEAGRVFSGLCRGRSALPFAAQAAEMLVRERLGLDRIVATVRRGRDRVPRVLTCGTQPTTALTHVLLGLTVEAAGD